ncbi:hypothetical protein FRC02_011067 [Tulasnella sp. 418]|nr:hypothetical protein FRC02_011067 [Tulasnella sp. 418]
MTQIKNPDPVIIPLPNSPPSDTLPLPDPDPPGGLTPGTYEVEEVDLLDRVNGMYRLLYLYSEAATSGLVDKVIIDQDSLGELMNTIVPRSYSSLSKIRFGALDQTSIQPVGIYGSKSQIVRLLQQLNCVDHEIADCLLQPRNEQIMHQPWLRSGIYYLNPNTPNLDTTQVPSYVIYWPDDTTWNDSAEDSVRRNRTTFMRYLTRLVGQTFALISPEHASMLVSIGEKSTDSKGSQEGTIRDNGGDGDGDDEDEDDFGRFYTFEVSKTKDQEEGVTVSPGFSVVHQAIKSQSLQSTSILHERDSQQTSDQSFAPTIITGEGSSGFLSVYHIPPGHKSRSSPGLERTKILLNRECSVHRNIFLAPSLGREGVHILIELDAVRQRAGTIIDVYHKELQKIDHRKVESIGQNKANLKLELQKETDTLHASCRAIVISKLLDIYPALDVSRHSTSETQEVPNHEAVYLQSLEEKHVGLSDIRERVFDRAQLHQVSTRGFQTAKANYPKFIQQLQSCADPEALTREFIEKNEVSTRESPVRTTQKLGYFSSSFGWITRPFWKQRPVSDNTGNKVDNHEISDSKFISSVAAIPKGDPAFSIKEKILDLFHDWIKTQIQTVTEALVSQFQNSILEEQATHVRAEAEIQSRKDISEVYETFLEKLKFILAPATTTRGIVFERIERIESRPQHYRVTSHETSDISGAFKHEIWALSLTEDDNRKLDQNPLHPIHPVISKWGSFEIPENCSVRYCQFLNGGRKCLVVIDQHEDVDIFIVNTATITRIPSLPPLRRLKKSGNRSFLMAVDEKKHLLAVTTITKTQVSLQMFAFDKEFTNLHARGSPLDVTTSYSDGLPSFHSIHFTGESEELCLVEKSGRIRIYSFVSQTFRPAIVELHSFVSVFPSPDGAALLVLERATRYGLRAFHWESFGHNLEGIQVDLPDDTDGASCQMWGVASFGIHCIPLLLGLDVNRHIIKSLNLHISRKDTEFSLRSKARDSKAAASTITWHNSLLDCHAAVWSKYPIVPAIKTEAFCPDVQYPTSLTFVSNVSESFSFPSYIKSLVRDFERQSRKPTYGRLEGIHIQVCAFDDIDWARHSQVNIYPTGEWMAGLLCLIPIQIAVARENRFIPLRDGVLDAATEQSLLGAEIGDIIEAISIGWYESIFNSYLAERPVKVISSMGEQSVGKSYALNHIVDSSFAGSALRTTEAGGVSLPIQTYP